MRALKAALILAVSVAACSKARPLQGTLGEPVSWQEDVAPAFAANCTSCHSGAAAAAGYRTTSYGEALGPQSAPVAVAGDASSRLLQTIDPAHADAVHAGVSGVFALTRAWVVDGQLSFFRSGVHPGGILNPSDPQFHGKVLQGQNWSFANCQKCHGADFTGGIAGVSCTQCHAKGPTSCDTCHGQPPATGAHAAHSLGALGKRLDCGECHVKPAQFDDPGHLTDASGVAKTKAVVTFGALASVPGPGRTGAPAWNGATCSNIACHGGAFTDTKALSTQPAWVGGTASCGSCHGLPPSGHDPSSTNCSACHAQVSTRTGVLNTALHVDGVVQVGDGSGTCSACHGSAKSPAPPQDLSGSTDTTARGVGAHEAHLFGSQSLSGTIACAACHLVPTDLHSPGHIDHALPATVIFSGLAVADGAQPAWDGNSCSTSYCHGGGAAMADDTNFKLRKPVWTLGPSQAYCGSCHGLPPGDTTHKGIVYPDCARCHVATVTPNGAIIVSGPPGARTSTHINGMIDANAP